MLWDNSGAVRCPEDHRSLRWQYEAYCCKRHIATAEIYDPLDNALLQSYPTAQWSVTNRGQKVQHKAPVEILATDLSAYIPDMVGEWYLVRLGHNNIGYIQKAYLKNIESVDMWEDSPGVNKNTSFQWFNVFLIIKTPGYYKVINTCINDSGNRNVKK